MIKLFKGIDYYKEGNLTCQLCSFIPNCVTCANGPVCTGCDTGYVVDFRTGNA